MIQRRDWKYAQLTVPSIIDVCNDLVYFVWYESMIYEIVCARLRYRISMQAAKTIYTMLSKT